MKDFKLRQKVIATYEQGKVEEYEGIIIGISWLTVANIAARVFAVKLSNGNIDTFSEGFLREFEEPLTV